MPAPTEAARTMPTSSPSDERLHVLVLNASPTHKMLFTAALNAREGFKGTAFHEPGTAEASEDVPRVILVDVGTEEAARNADELLRKALSAYPNAATMLLSDKPSSAIIKELMRRHPLSGCVISTQTLESVAASLMLASEGMAVLPAELLDKLRRGKAPNTTPARSGRRGGSAGPRFTGRQSDVCQLLMEGLSNKAIAYRLGIAENTVKNHVRSIMSRMGVISRTQLVLALFGGR
jgi:DNA-binding NarL/FixJ family response regulator